MPAQIIPPDAGTYPGEPCSRIETQRIKATLTASWGRICQADHANDATAIMKEVVLFSGNMFMVMDILDDLYQKGSATKSWKNRITESKSAQGLK